MAKIIWTGPALDDLNAIAEYIALDKPDAAGALVQRIVAHIDLLAEHPRLGSRIPELLPRSRYRQIIEPPCRVFYRYQIASDTCYILHVIRGEKLFQKRLLVRRDRETLSE
jgi:plasmid stabilization system protein ParE